ncbi:hypothetical protein WJX82_000557 [Trebouxia sp. C0006]
MSSLEDAQGSRRRNIPAAGYPVSATPGGVPDLAPYPQPPSGPGPNPPAETSLREKAKKGDLQPDITDASLKTKIKAAHGPGDKQPDVEEGGVKAQPAQKDVYHKIHNNPVGITLFSLFMATYIFYFYVRIRYTLFGGYFGYSLFILIVEMAASTNMILYGILLTRRKEYIDHPITRRFHVRVLIPCYSESLEIVSATALAARRATLPPGVRRTVYILDDGKDPDKKTWVESLKDPDMLYTPGHIKTGPEVNGKACNLNSTLRALFPAGSEVGLEELIVVFDADMVCSTEFFMKTLPRIVDDRVSLVLTPQAYHNYDPATDIFNHSAYAYWSMMVPGEDAWGHIVCTGSNFVMRTKHCQEAGWFPTYTMCEDFALALELQAKKYKAAYVQEFLALGEVPVTVRGTFQQRSRWCKGGMQIWFSRRNWWLRRDIPLMQKFLWSISCWGYITQSFATPVFLAIPIVGVWFRIFPIDNTLWFALAFTLYFPMMHVMAYYCHDYATFRSFWFATINSNNMWYCFLKAWCNVAMSKITKKESGFKVTAKSTMSTTAKMTPKAAASKLKRTTSQTLVKQGRKLDMENYCAPGVRDLWMPVSIFLLNLATIFLGIYRLDKESVPSELMTFNMVVSVLWAAYNSIPPLLLLHFAFAGYKGMRFNVRLCGLLATLLMLGVIICVWLLLPPTYDFGQALQYSMSFFDAEKSGTLTANDISWRGNSALSDSLNGSSLVGGFYDGANGYVKYGYPIAVTTMMLAWGLIEFPQGYADMGETTRALKSIKVGADYITSCSVSDSEFVVQVGNYALDLVDLNSPEDMTQARPVYIVNATSPGSDLVGASAAALAAAAVVFNASDHTYSTQLLATAESLYNFGCAYEGLVSDSVPQVSYAYLSTSYLDDLAFAAAWLYKATGNSTYLSSAMTYKARSLSEEADAARNYNVFNYQNSLPGVNLLLAQATNFATNEYTLATKGLMIVWMSGKYTIRYTPKLLAYSPDNPLRNAANAGLIAVIYAKHQAKKYNCWAESQARYVLGSGSRSFMVGYGQNPPTHTLDKVSMCDGTSCVSASSSAKNPHMNYGAVVEGPTLMDNYSDNRTSSSMAGVHLDTNAGLSGLLSALKELNLNWAECTAGVNFVKMQIQGRPI